MKLWLSLRNPFSRPGSGRDVVPAAGDEPANSDLAMGPAAGAEASDDELLRKFVVERDDRAFGLLVERHSGMVMGVCRRVLGIQQDAEDAFQAVFLQLARKANTLRCGGSLPAWLHKTAFRTALRARADRGRRREQPTEDLQMFAEPELRNVTLEHDRSIVDEELNALPERYRLPLYLCCIEGKTLDVAARQLGWSVGSVKGRLERGRTELRRRLLLRRVAPTFGFLLLAGLAPTAQAAMQTAAAAATLQATTYVSPSLIAATVQAGMQQAAGRSALGYVTQNALQLSKGSWNFMSLTTTKFVACSLAALGLAIGGGSYLPSPAGAVGTGQGVTLEASFAPSAADAAADDASAFFAQLALADEGGAKTGPRDGDAPKTGPRDGDAPRTGPRDGEQPKAGPRDGERPRTGAKEGDAPRTGPREGDAPRTGAREGDAPRPGVREGEKPRVGSGERPNPRNALQNFKPQTPREEALFQAILQMQQEIAQLRQMVQQQGGRGVGEGGRAPARGEGAPKAGPRE